MGGFDPGYFMYVEDADITRKAMQYGKVFLLPQFGAVHAWHRNPSRDLDARSSFLVHSPLFHGADSIPSLCQGIFSVV